ncbi:MAG: DUF2218 domain-containing protein [Jatrophihabitans sp.]|uniref:DUF2218 domain-containing protein n=1 Tax=Jatrophihabitans sp. TaxID=1932789 RepID=UPI0039127508
MTDEYQATAAVATEAAARYAKQLVSHLGRRLEVREEDRGTRLVFPSGSCLLVVSDVGLELIAGAADAASLENVKDVVARHLERFGQRNELTVHWN